jgi:O-antigen/teichoic acid export membrane protein
MSASDLAESVTSGEELHANVTPQGPQATMRRARWIRRWLTRLTTFAVGQGLLQAISLITGFLLIRWLSVDDYAAYSLATGFQGTAGVLIEMGLGGSIVALLAGRTDRQVVGRYIRSVRHFRNRLFVIFLPIVLLAFSVLTSRQGWSWPLTAIILAGILLTLYGQSLATYYSAPLIVHQELGLYYRTPTLLGAARLLSSFGLHALSLLTSAVAVWVGSAATMAQGWFYKRHSHHYAIEPAMADPGTNREVLAFIRPLIPSTIFFALQGQITILLISWFGQTQSIAEVGALGRLAQLFLMLGAFNSVVIAPAVAKLSEQLLPVRYLQILGGALCLTVGMVALSAFAPELLLWILGKKYIHLKAELVWMMIASCVSYLSNVMWTMHSARRWIFSWGVWANIVTVVLVQAFGIGCMNLSTTDSVIRLSLYSSLATFLISIVYALAGFAPLRQSKAKGAIP